MSSVSILLATCNGEKYLPAQLDSLLSQSCQDFKILIFDDGSSDSTYQILETYRCKHPHKIDLYRNQNASLGVNASFSRLVEYAKSPYVFFCDQDDVWNNHKVENNVRLLRDLERQSGEGTPAMVFSDLRVTDDDLNAVADSFYHYQRLDPEKGKTFPRLLVQNIFVGNTLAVNRPLLDLAFPVPASAIMYDWWLGLVASCFGVIKKSETIGGDYRQHHDNQVGAKVFGGKYLWGNLPFNSSLARDSVAATQAQARAFAEVFAELGAGHYVKLARRYGDADSLKKIDRVRLLLDNNIKKVPLVRNLGLYWAI